MALPSLDLIVADVMHAVRQLRRAKAFSLAAIATIALGIGLNTAAFTIFDAVALRPLAVRAPAELVRIVRADDQSTGDYLRYSDVERLARDDRALASVIATSAPQGLVATLDGESAENARAVAARFVSPDFFQALGVAPERGRAFAPGESQVAVVSHAFWTRRLAADPAAVGRTINIGGTQLTIVGVAPRAFTGTGLPPMVPDLWVPLDMQPVLIPGADWRTDDAHRDWQVLARLRPGTTLGQASTALAVVSRDLPPIDNAPMVLRAKAATLFQADAGEFDTFVQAGIVVMAAVALLLAIGCVNLVSLISARNSSRARDVNLRIALGASRARIAWQLCAESALLGAAGGAAGIAVAALLTRRLDAWLTESLERVVGTGATFALDLTPNWHVVAYGGTLALVIGVAVGIWPAVSASRRNAAEILKQGGTATEGGARWGLRNVLLATQVAGSLVLLTGAAMLFHGVSASRTVDPGFDVARALVVAVDVKSLGPAADARVAQLRRITSRIEAAPDVRAVAWTTNPPFVGHRLRNGNDGIGPITIGRDYVASSYFDAFSIPLVAGRAFTRDEAERGAAVVVISASLAQRYWPGQDPIGHSTAERPFLNADDNRAYTIVGVARDVRHTWLSRPDAGFEYFPLALAASPGLLIVGTRGAAAAALGATRNALAAVDPALPLRTTIVTMEDGPMAVQRLMAAAPATLASALAAFGLILTAVGLYGVVAQMVVRRTREIGIRTALGATRRGVLMTVARHTLRPVAWGAAIGAVGAVGVSVALAALVRIPDAPDLTYGRGAFDPVAFLAVFGALITVVVAAMAVPAARAMRVDPLVALRDDG